MTRSSQQRATRSYRQRLARRGLRRFEVLGLESDRELIRSLARRLAENDPEAMRLRAEVNRKMTAEEPRRGRIWAALRRSPLVAAELDLVREVTEGRDVEL